MAHTGRKPLAARHVDHLRGSEHARQRMKLLLECMLGEKTIPEACGELGICESRYHAMRNQWMQEALELLEPRPTGRPPKAPRSDELQQRLSQLETENQQLREQLQAAEVSRQIAEILPQAAHDARPVKKGTRRPR